MPLPLGHAAIGWAAYETINSSPLRDGRSAQGSRLGRMVFAAILANLPDLDVLFGLIVYGNGAAIHRGPTHSLLFSLLAGFLAAHAWRLWQRIPRMGFGSCAGIVFSHVVADIFFTNSPVSLLWPLELHFSTGYNGWGQVVHMVLFQSIQDAGIVVFCLIYALALRYVRSKTVGFPLLVVAKKRMKS